MRTFTKQLRCIPRTFRQTDLSAGSLPMRIRPDYDAFCLLPAMVRRGVDLDDWYERNIGIADSRPGSFRA